MAAKPGPQLVAVTRPARAASGNPAPHYPAISRALGEEGKVSLRVLVLPDGSAGGVTVLQSSGFPRLDRAARAAVLRYRFQPAVKAGQPVASFIPYWIEFVLK
jgi:protein TonB